MGFLDVAKAYDKTWHNGLLYRMRKIGIPAKVLKLWKSSYSQINRRMMINEHLTDPFSCASGLAQGAVDSPTLYDVFVDELASELFNAGYGVIGPDGKRIPLLMYADDVVLLSESPEQLQRMLNAVSCFAKKWRFTYNTSKSAVVVAGATSLLHKQRARSMKWFLNGEVLPVPDTYLYLGLEFGLIGNGRWSGAVNRLISAARNRTRELLYANGNQLGLSAPLQVRLWNTMCRPILEYGCALWGPELSADLSRQIESLHTHHAKSSLGLPTHASSFVVRGELGIHTLASRRDLLALRLFGDMLCSSDNRLAARIIRSRLKAARASASNNTLNQHYGWCAHMLQVLNKYDLSEYWWSDITIDKKEWLRVCAKAVSTTRNKEWSAAAARSGYELYSTMKYAPSARPERYLTSANRFGRHLQFLARCDQLPLNAYLSAIANYPNYDTCRACTALGHESTREDTDHFLRKCPAYLNLRNRLYDHIQSVIFRESCCQYISDWFVQTTDLERWQWLLGGDMHQLSEEAAAQEGRRFGEWQAALYKTCNIPEIRDRVNRAVQHFLMLAIRERDRVCGGLRMVLIRSDVQPNVLNVIATRDQSVYPPVRVVELNSPTQALPLPLPPPPRKHVKSSLPLRVALLQCEYGRSAERKRYSRSSIEPLALSNYVVVRTETQAQRPLFHTDALRRRWCPRGVSVCV